MEIFENSKIPHIAEIKVAVNNPRAWLCRALGGPRYAEHKKFDNREMGKRKNTESPICDSDEGVSCAMKSMSARPVRLS